MQSVLNHQFTLQTLALSDSLFRLSMFPTGGKPGSGLNRYGMIDDLPEFPTKQTRSDTGVSLSAGATGLDVTVSAEPVFTFRAGGKDVLCGRVQALPNGTFVLELDLSDGERLFGLGDQTRDRIEQRGTKADLNVRNVASYVPIPFLMSTRGWGVLVNTTFRHAWDVGASDTNKVRVLVPDRQFDLYLFYGPDFKTLLDRYTQLTGRPALPPKWSFGLWFICRTQANDFEVMSDAANFRDRNIPCDVIGLEPGWMEKSHDTSVDKKWSEQRFPIPPWGWTGPFNFFNALKRMGYKYELWLCCDYDVSFEAERMIGNQVEIRGKKLHEFLEDDTEKDPHFFAPITHDPYTKPEEGWFEHLKKFIDQGADFFKQDGAWQICDHPNRMWGNGMTDEEMHNLYPLLYSQQMVEGFKNYTTRRPVGFTPAGWIGLQRFTGTWTGDTGGGAKTLVACLNLALSGHSLVTCDMEIITKEGIHYGFLMPWAQLNSWDYFRHPWLQGDVLYPIFCDYARLRSRLVPYVYTYAHTAHETGTPMMRPLVLEFPDDPKTVNVLTEWCLGRELLATAFSDQVYLPAGKWLDFWTGKTHVSPEAFKYDIPENRGGGLFLRENSILVLGPLVQYVGQKTDRGFELIVFVEPEKSAVFDLYDDDGVSFEYRNGKFTVHSFRANFVKNVLSVQAPEALKIDTVTAYLAQKPDRVRFNGKGATFTWSADQNFLTFTP